MVKLRKVFTGGLAALTLSGALAASTPAEAWYRPYGYYGGGWYGGGWGGGGALAAGLIGGLAIGALAASAAAPAYGYGYYPYAGYASYPAYGYPAYSYGYYPAYSNVARPRRARRVCRVSRPVFDAWGRFAGYQRLRVRC